MGRSSVGMQRNQDSSMLHAVQSRCRIVAAEHMPDGHGRQSTKGMPLAVRMLVLLERAKWFEGSTPGTDNSKAQVVSDGACVSHLCRPTHSNSHPHSECERVEFHRNLRATSTERALIFSHIYRARPPTTMMVRQPYTSLHFPGLGLWRGAPAAPDHAGCTADRRCHLVGLRPRSW